MWKAFKWKAMFRILAVVDVLSARKFTLTTYTKDGTEKNKTRFCQKEIEEAFK